MTEPNMQCAAEEPRTPIAPRTAARRDVLELRVEAALERIGRDLEPRPDWQARVLAAIARDDEPRVHWLRRWLAQIWGDGLAAVIVLALSALMFARFAPPDDRTLAIAIERTAAEDGCAHIGDRAAAGDVVRMAARGGDGQHALRVYRDGALVIACPGPTCPSGEAVDLVVAAGAYVVLATTGPSLPRFAGVYSADRAAAVAAGAELATRRLDVR